MSRAEGKAEAILDILADLGEISADLQKQIMAERDPECLRQWLKFASKAQSLEEFEQKRK